MVHKKTFVSGAKCLESKGVFRSNIAAQHLSLLFIFHTVRNLVPNSKSQQKFKRFCKKVVLSSGFKFARTMKNLTRKDLSKCEMYFVSFTFVFRDSFYLKGHCLDILALQKTKKLRIDVIPQLMV